MNGLGASLMAVGMIGALALLIGGLRAARRPANRQQGLLMVAAAVVIVANVLIWTL